MAIENRTTFGMIMDRVGIGAVCLIGWYAGNRFEKMSDRGEEVRDEVRLETSVNAQQKILIEALKVRLDSLEAWAERQKERQARDLLNQSSQRR